MNALSAASVAEIGDDGSNQTAEPETDDLIRVADIVLTLGRDAHVDHVSGTQLETWETEEPSERAH